MAGAGVGFGVWALRFGFKVEGLRVQVMSLSGQRGDLGEAGEG